MMPQMGIGAAAAWSMTAAAVLIASTPMPALAQRGLSNTRDAVAVETDHDPNVQGAVQRGQGMRMGQGMRQGQDMPQGRGMPQGQGMPRGQAAQASTERERLEQMREHMVSGMRRMAVRMAAIQDRLATLERGDDNAPPVAGAMGRMGQRDRMGMGQGMQRSRDQGMRMRDGTGPGCRATPAPASPSPPPAGGRGGDR